MTTTAAKRSDLAPAWCLGSRSLEIIALIAATAIAYLTLAEQVDDAFKFSAIATAVSALTVWIVLEDLKTLTIADGAVASIAVLATAERWSVGESLLGMGLDCLLSGGVLLAFREIYYRRKGFDGLGLGDVKLATAGGLLVGAAAFAWALLAASLIALAVVGMKRLTSGRGPLGLSRDGSDKLAFGCALAPSILAFWFAQKLPDLLPLAGFS